MENDKMILRPSSIDSFLQCPQQWYRVFILGEHSIPNSRAAIGTAIHKGVEVMWKDSMQVGQKIISPGSMADAAVEAFEEEEQKDLQYDSGEDKNTCIKEVIVGLDTFVDDIVPWVPVPTDVEARFDLTITDHPIVGGVSGQLDYLDKKVGVLADVKTGKRKHNVANSSTQQSIYTLLAEENGVKVNNATIQNVVLKTKPEGHIMDSQINIPKAKAIVNTLLDTLKVYSEDKVDPDILFRGNPKYYLCSPKYCRFFNECKFTG